MLEREDLVEHILQNTLITKGKAHFPSNLKEGIVIVGVVRYAEVTHPN